MSLATTLAASVESAPRSRTRPARKSSTPKVEPKTKLGLCLSADSARRLAVYAAMEGCDRSEVVEALIVEHLKKYRVQTISGDRAADVDLAGSVTEGRSEN